MQRREFLKLAGVTTFGLGLDATFPALGWAANRPTYGRVLTRTALHRHPNHAAPIPDYLWPDSLHRMLAVQGNWVQLAGGYSRAVCLQPCLPTQDDVVSAALPTWVEVRAPYAALRAWAAPDAPLTTRIGHGGVLWASESLHDRQGHRWLKLDEFGWVQAQHMQPSLPKERIPTATHAVLEGYGLTLYADEDILLSCVVARPTHLPQGEHIIIRKHPSYAHPQYPAAPWMLATDGGIVVHGVYWHHEFGRGAGTVQLSAIAAKVVVAALGVGTPLLIH